MRWNCWKKWLTPKVTQPMRRERKYRPQVEELEGRIAPVVGNFYEAPVLAPGQEYTLSGGTRMNLDGVVYIDGGGGLQGTGSLMTDGIHILTAAHVAPATAQRNVNFAIGPTADGRKVPLITIAVPANRQTIEPNFGPVANLQAAANAGNDLSLMRLVDGAGKTLVAPYYGGQPNDANQIGYPLVDNGFNGAQQQYTVVGYGLIGTGAIGGRAAPNPQKSLGSNYWDTTGDQLRRVIQTVGLRPNGPLPANGGKFKLTYTAPGQPNGVTTAAIDWNANAQTVKDALVAVAPNLQNDLDVTGGILLADAAIATRGAQSPGGGQAEAITWLLSFKGGLVGQAVPQVQLVDGDPGGADTLQLIPATSTRLTNGAVALPVSTLLADFDNGIPLNDAIGLTLNRANTNIPKTDEQQVITLGAIPAPNTKFRLRFTLPATGPGNPARTFTTDELDWNATNIQVRDKLSQMNNGGARPLWDPTNNPIPGNNFTLTGNPGGPYTITFERQMSGVDLPPLQVIVNGTVYQAATVRTERDGLMETSTAPGDSGGPHFIDGKIAGVVSMGNGLPGRVPDIDSNPANQTYGEFNLATNVGSFVDNFIMPTMNMIRPSSGQPGAAATDIVFDMNTQALGVDHTGNNPANFVVDNITINVRRVNDNIEIQVLNQNPAVDARFNGVYFRMPAVDINSLTIRGGPDNETINLIGALGCGAITVHGGGGSNTINIGALGAGNLNNVTSNVTASNADALNINDTNAGAGRNYTTTPGNPNVFGWGQAATISFSAIRDYNLHAGNGGANTIPVPRWTGVTNQNVNGGGDQNTFTVTGTNTQTIINGGLASITNIQATTAATNLTVNALGVGDIVNVGSNNTPTGTMNDIAGPIEVNGAILLDFSNGTRLNLNDRGSNAPNAYTVNANNVVRNNNNTTIITFGGLFQVSLNGAVAIQPPNAIINGPMANLLLDAGGGVGAFSVLGTAFGTVAEFVGSWSGTLAGEGGMLVNLGAWSATGSFDGDLANEVGGTINPGADGVAGTITLGHWFINLGALRFDLGADAGASDLVTASVVDLETIDQDGNLVRGSLQLNAVASILAEDYTIIDNTGADPVWGIFAGMPEGTIVPIDGHNFQISYVGGDGNDVVLIAMDSPPITLGNLSNGQTITLDFNVLGMATADVVTMGFQINDGPVVPVTVNPDGSFTIPITAADAPPGGTYILTVYAWDDSNSLITTAVTFNTSSNPTGSMVDLVFDMNDYALGQDSNIDEITVSARVNGPNLEIEVVDPNAPQLSGVYLTALVANISSLTIIGALDNELIDLIGLLGVGLVNLQGGGGNNRTVIGNAVTGTLNDVVNNINVNSAHLTINDPTGVGRNYTITDNRISWNAAASIDITNVTTSITINGSNGTNVFNVQKTVAGRDLTINTKNGTNTVNVGNAGLLNNIAGDLYVNVVGTGTARVNLNDNAQPNGKTYEVFRTAARRIDLASTIYLAGVTNLTITGGGRVGGGLQLNFDNLNPQPPGPPPVPNRFRVFGTPNGCTTILNGGVGVDEFDVGTANPRTLNDIGGPLIMSGGAGMDDIRLYDTGSVQKTYTVTGTTVVRTGGPTITYNSRADIEDIHVYAGADVDNFNVQASLRGCRVSVDGGAGNDIFNVGGAAPNADSLSPFNTFRSGVWVTGGAGNDELNINDQGAPSGQAYTITNTSVQRDGTGAITYATSDNVEIVRVRTAAGAPATPNVIRNRGVAQGTNLNVAGGPQNDQFFAGSADDNTSNLAAMLGTLTLSGGDGEDTLTINDKGGAAARTFTVTDTTVDATGGMGRITFDTMEALAIDGRIPARDSGLTIDDSNVNAGRTYNMTAGADADTPNVLTRGTIPVNFTSMRDVTLKAAQGDNTINVAALIGVTNLEVNGGNGTDTIEVASTNTATTINGGLASTVNIRATTAATSLTVNAYGVADIVNVGSTNDNQSNMDGIVGTIQLNGCILLDSSNGTRLNLNDQGSNAPNAYRVTADQVIRAAGNVPIINFGGVFRVTLNGPPANQVFDVILDGADTQVVLNAGNGTFSVLDIGASATFIGTWVGSINGSGGTLINTGAWSGAGAFDGNLTDSPGGDLFVGAAAMPGVITLTGAYKEFGTLHFDLGYSTFDTDAIAADSVALSYVDPSLGPISGYLQLNAMTGNLAPSYLLISNTGGAAVDGTFNGLPEGALVPVGTQNYTITYLGGDGNDVALVQAPNPPVITVANLANGQTVAPGYNVTGSVTGTGTTLAAQIDSGALIAVTIDANGAFTFPLDGVAAGPHSITFTAFGANGTTTTTTITFTVSAPPANPQSTSVSLAISDNTPGDGFFSLDATISSQTSAFKPGGTVQFWDGVTLLGSGYVDLTGHCSILVSTDLAFGSHSIFAVYSGDANFTGSSSAGTIPTITEGPCTVQTGSGLALLLGNGKRLRVDPATGNLIIEVITA